MHRNRGFTLIELLVVISIIALLIALLLPALGKAKDNALVLQSLSQKRQLTLGWATYTNDSDGKLVGAGTGGIDFGDWVRSAKTGETRQERIEALQDGLLWPYLEDISIYKTPNDPRAKAMRSDSISDYLNGQNFAGGQVAPRNEDAISIEKLDAMQRPSETMVFLEEWDPRDEFDNLGSWITWPITRGQVPANWIDFPANLAFGGNVHSFWDGHAVFYRFQNTDTAKLDMTDSPVGNGVDDYRYFASIYLPLLDVNAGGRGGRRRRP